MRKPARIMHACSSPIPQLNVFVPSPVWGKPGREMKTNNKGQCVLFFQDSRPTAAKTGMRLC